MQDIVVIGSLNMDLVVRVPKMPKPGETILGDNFKVLPGGKGANQAVAAARLGAKVTMIGRVGEDDFGRTLIQNLEVEGINVANITRDLSTASGIAMITVDESGQNSIVVASGANMCLKPEHIRKAWKNLGNVDFVVMPLEIPLDCIIEATRLGKASGATILLNPAPAQELPDDLLQEIDILIPNETELEILSGLPVHDVVSAKEAARFLLQKGVPAIIITLGEKGALLLEDEMEIYILSEKVEVVDTTAAGDSFIGGLTTALTKGWSLEKAVRYANCAGAAAVTKFGAQPSLPTPEDVDILFSQGNLK